jgi:hypothetical protein
MTLTFPMISVLMMFGLIFAACWLAKLNSPVIDACAYILAAIIFVIVLLSKLPF